MANIKISALPAAAALTGTEAVPVVQSGVTVKTTAAAIAATGTTPTLNLVTTAGNSTTPSIVFKASGSGSTAYVSNSTGNWLSLNGVAEVVPAGGIAPVTTTTYALGSTSFRWAKLWSYDADLSGALAVSGNVTPALLTASKPVFTDASKNLVSTGTLAYDQGGTGQTTYAAGDIVYASATNTLTKLAIGTNGQVLKVTSGLLPAWGTDSAGTGTVTSASVVSANGFAGTVATATTTPAITLTTSITGLLKGNATAISAATAATDYVAPSSYASANGLTMATARILGRTTASTGAAEEITIGSGLSMTAGTLTSTGSGGSVTSVAATVPTFLSVAGSPITTSGTLAVTLSGTALPNTSGGTGATAAFTQYGVPYASSTTVLATTAAGTTTTVLHGNAAGAPTFGAVSLTADVSGTLPVANGGTGAATLTANYALLGNGTSALQMIAPGTSGNLLTSNGTTWASTAPSGASAATATVLGTVYASQTTSGGTPYLTAFGYNAGVVNTGTSNSAIGFEALKATTSGTGNLAAGYQSGIGNIVGSESVYVGYQAGYSDAGAGQNTYVGSYAGGLVNGGFNTFIGRNAGSVTTNGTSGVAIGDNAGKACNKSVYIGRNSAPTSAGFYNSFIGSDEQPNTVSSAGCVSIGGSTNTGNALPVFDLTTQNNRISMGSTSTTNAYVQVAWTVVSDARDKMNFAPVPHGLDFVNKLNPIAFQFKEARDIEIPNGPIRYGFKAQEILALEGNNPVIIDNDNSEKLRYNGEALVPVLVKALQELNAKFDAYVLAHP